MDESSHTRSFSHILAKVFPPFLLRDFSPSPVGRKGKLIKSLLFLFLQTSPAERVGGRRQKRRKKRRSCQDIFLGKESWESFFLQKKKRSSFPPLPPFSTVALGTSSSSSSFPLINCPERLSNPSARVSFLPPPRKAMMKSEKSLSSPFFRSLENNALGTREFWKWRCVWEEEFC